MSRAYFLRNNALELFAKIVVKSRQQNWSNQYDSYYLESLLNDVDTLEAISIAKSIREHHYTLHRQNAGLDVPFVDDSISPKVFYSFQQQIIDNQSEIFVSRKTFQQFKNYIGEPNFNSKDRNSSISELSLERINPYNRILNAMHPQNGVETLLFLSKEPPLFANYTDELLATIPVTSYGFMRLYPRGECFIKLDFLREDTFGRKRDKFWGAFQFKGQENQYLTLEIASCYDGKNKSKLFFYLDPSFGGLSIGQFNSPNHDVYSLYSWLGHPYNFNFKADRSTNPAKRELLIYKTLRN